MRDDIIALAVIIAPLSLVAIGGASSIYAPLQHQTVDVHQWLTAREFLDLFAIARVTPGPGSMIATLIGWKIGGIWGALAATLALFVPSCVFCFVVSRAWSHYRGTAWHAIIESGLRPLAGGLVLAAVLVLLKLTGIGVFAGAVVLASTAALTWWPRVHPGYLLLGGGAIFLAAHFAGIDVL